MQTRICDIRTFNIARKSHDFTFIDLKVMLLLCMNVMWTETEDSSLSYKRFIYLSLLCTLRIRLSLSLCIHSHKIILVRSKERKSPFINALWYPQYSPADQYTYEERVRSMNWTANCNKQHTSSKTKDRKYKIHDLVCQFFSYYRFQFRMKLCACRKFDWFN